MFIRRKLKWAISFNYQLLLYLQKFDFQDFLGLPQLVIALKAFLIALLIYINNKKLDQIISKLLKLSKYFTYSLISFCACGTFFIIPWRYLYWALLNRVTTNDHSRPSTTIHNHLRPDIILPPLPTTRHKFATTTHDRP